MLRTFTLNISAYQVLGIQLSELPSTIFPSLILIILSALEAIAWSWVTMITVLP
jgi:hypothetical protein